MSVAHHDASGQTLPSSTVTGCRTVQPIAPVLASNSQLPPALGARAAPPGAPPAATRAGRPPEDTGALEARPRSAAASCCTDAGQPPSRGQRCCPAAGTATPTPATTTSSPAASPAAGLHTLACVPHRRHRGEHPAGAAAPQPACAPTASGRGRCPAQPCWAGGSGRGRRCCCTLINRSCCCAFISRQRLHAERHQPAGG